MSWKKVEPLAIDAVLGSMKQCREYLKTIEGRVEDCLSVSPDDVDWGLQLDARHLESELQKIVTWLTG